MMNMPEVKNCAVQECFYNTGEWCHAPAINVGSGHPVCDTFAFRNDRHATPADIGLVGACHMADCKFNDDLACHAGSINVDHHMGHPDCVTFDPRPDVEEDIEVQIAEETPNAQTTGSKSFRLGPTPEA
jgi:hypothetical protein